MTLNHNNIWVLNFFKALFKKNVVTYCTEVGRAPLIHFQKIFFQKGFLQIQISQRTQILYMDDYIGQEKSQKGPKNVQKSHKLDLRLVFQKKIVLANQIHINRYNMRKKEDSKRIQNRSMNVFCDFKQIVSLFSMLPKHVLPV